MQIKEILSGARIAIRDYTVTDYAFATDMWFDEENGRYLSDPTRDHIDEVYQSALDKMEDSASGYYLIAEDKETGRPIGTCCLFPDEERKSYDIGYCIHRDLWNRGYGTEVVALLTEWVRAHGGGAVTAEVALENTASNLLLKKLGFEVERESTFKKYKMDICYKSSIWRRAL